MSDKVTSTGVAVDLCEVFRANIKDDVDGLKKTINGNGKAGLKTDVAIMKRSQKTTNGLLVTVIGLLIGIAIYIIRMGLLK